MTDPTMQALSDAIAALGDIMLEMQRRRLLERPSSNPFTRAMLSARSLTDEQLGTIAADAFEAGATFLAERNAPGAQVFRCNPSEEPTR